MTSMTLNAHHHPQMSSSVGLTAAPVGMNATRSPPSTLRPSDPSCPGRGFYTPSRYQHGAQRTASASTPVASRRGRGITPTSTPSPYAPSPYVPSLSSSTSSSTPSLSSQKRATSTPSPPLLSHSHILTNATIDKRPESVLASASLRVHPFINMGQTATKFAVPPESSTPPEADNGREREQEIARKRQCDYERQRERNREREREQRERERERTPLPLPKPVELEEVLLPTSNGVASPMPLSHQSSSTDMPSTTAGKVESAAPGRRGLGLVRKLSFRTRERAVTGPLSPSRGEPTVPVPPLTVAGASTVPPATPVRPSKSQKLATHERSVEFAIGLSRNEDDPVLSKPGLLSRAASVGHAVARPRPVRARANASPMSVGPGVTGATVQRLATIPASVSSLSDSPSPFATDPSSLSTASPRNPSHSREHSLHKDRLRKTPQNGSSPRSRASLTARREREWRAKLASLTLASPPRTPPVSTTGPRPPPRRVQRPSMDKIAADEPSLASQLIKTAPDPMSSSATFKEAPLPPTPSPLRHASAIVPTDSPEFGFLTPATRERELGTTFGGANVSPAISAVGKNRGRSVVSMTRSVSTSSAFDRASVISRGTSRSGASTSVGAVPGLPGRPELEAPPPVPPVPTVHRTSTSMDSQMSRSTSLNPPPSPAFTLALSLKSPPIPSVPQLPPPLAVPSARGSLASIATASSGRTAEKERERKKRNSAASSAQLGSLHTTSSTMTSSSNRTHDITWIPDERVVVSRASVPDMHAFETPVSAATPRRGTAFEVTASGTSAARTQLTLPSPPTVIAESPVAMRSTYSRYDDEMERPDMDMVMDLQSHARPQLKRQGTTASASTTNSTSTSFSTSYAADPIPLVVSSTKRAPPKPAFFPSRGATLVNLDTRVGYSGMSCQYSDELMMSPGPMSPPTVPVVPTLPGLGHGVALSSRRKPAEVVHATSTGTLRHGRQRSREAIAIDGLVRGPADFAMSSIAPLAGLAPGAAEAAAAPYAPDHKVRELPAPPVNHSLQGVDLTPGLASGRRPRKTGLPMADLQRWLAQTSQ